MIDIERLVRRVLTDLQPAMLAVPNLAESKLVQPTSAVATGEMRLSNRVITLTELKERLETIKRLIVPEKAIITPAVRDELRKRNIELVFGGGAESSQNRSEGIPRVWLGLHLLKKEPTVLIDRLKKEYALRQQSFECILEAMKQAARELQEEPTRSLAVVLTNYSAGAMCIANRHPGLRAVLGFEPAALKIDAAQTGANVLVLDPDRSGPFKSRELLKTFLDGGVRKVPGYLRGQRTEDR